MAMSLRLLGSIPLGDHDPDGAIRIDQHRPEQIAGDASRIVGIVPADTPRETLGLMMTGERPKDVVA